MMLSERIPAPDWNWAAAEQLTKPIFHGIYWKGLPGGDEELLTGPNKTVILNGIARHIEVIGWQGSRNGLVELHREDNLQEDVFVVAGHIAMTTIDLAGKHTVYDKHGILPVEALDKVGYVLAIGSEIEGHGEHFILNTEANWAVPIYPLITEKGWSHTTMIMEPSVYFVVKHRPV